MNGKTKRADLVYLSQLFYKPNIISVKVLFMPVRALEWDS